MWRRGRERLSEERREKKEKEDKEEEGRMGRRRQRQEEEGANTAPMPLCQFMWSMEREMSLLLTTSLKLSPLQFYSFSLHSDFSGSQAGGIKREHGQETTPQGPAGPWHQITRHPPQRPVPIFNDFQG